MASLGNLLEGVGSIDITTDDLSASIEFFTEVLGGKLLEKWSVSFKGEGHSQRIFAKELDRARLEKVDPWKLGVPDITGEGSVYEVHWRFILYDNILVKLVQYTRCDDGAAVSLRDELTSPAICPNPHLCWWLGDVDINKYIRTLENAAKQRNLAMVYFNRNVPVENEEDRAAVPENKLANEILQGEFSPVAMAYFKGPRGEQMELFQLKGDLSDKWRKAMIEFQSPSTAFLPINVDNPLKQSIGMTAKLYGINHFGIRVKDLKRSLEFYCGVLGGKIFPVKGDHLQSDVFMQVLYQKEMLQAKALGRSFESMYIPDGGFGGQHWVNVRLIQFGSTTIELLEYCQGDKENPSKYDPTFEWTSPAYTNTMTLTFAVREEANFADFLQNFHESAKEKGFSDLNVSSLPKGKDNLFEGKDIEGYDYFVFKGPSGEHLAFCQFSGVSRKYLHDELVNYQGISVMFDDLNPFKN